MLWKVWNEMVCVVTISKEKTKQSRIQNCMPKASLNCHLNHCIVYVSNCRQNQFHLFVYQHINFIQIFSCTRNNKRYINIFVIVNIIYQQYQNETLWIRNWAVYRIVSLTSMSECQCFCFHKALHCLSIIILKKFHEMLQLIAYAFKFTMIGFAIQKEI
jgi:hypothetical protein